MHELLLDANSLSQHLSSRIPNGKVRVRESNGTITLIPLAESKIGRSRLFGMLAGTGLSTDAYCAQKQRDKGLD
jgi:hypothetical protein